jgi:curved DNA-binding protein CbpA
MSSPLPIDPYTVLGVQKDADISAIRSSGRKLMLKYHPDRLRDESERANGLEVFQRIQTAYELLSDPSMRSRYDDKVKLAQLRKEAMEAVPNSKGFEPEKGRTYEDRGPRSSYHDSEKGFGRDSARKYDEYGPTSSTRRESSGRYAEYEWRSSARWEERERGDKQGEKATIGVPINAAIKFNTNPSKIELTKEKAREKERARERERARENESLAPSGKTRDREKRGQRSDKPTTRYAIVSDSDSDSDGYYPQSSAKRGPDYTGRIQARIPRSMHHSWEEELPGDRPGLYRSSTNPQQPNPKRPEPQHSRSNESRGRGL